MTPLATVSLPDLYEDDETAWLDTMADLIAAGAYSELDYANLREYLCDMAKRDRREVESRLVILVLHILKWLEQPELRSRSWHATIAEQQQELRRLVGRGVLRNHADMVLADVYRDAIERAAIETGLPPQRFPTECAFTIDELLSFAPTHDTEPQS